MKNLVTVGGGLIGILLMGPLVKEAAAGSLTGTWSGTATCAGVVGGSTKGPIDDIPLTIAISQNGKDLNLEITLTTSELNGDLNSPPSHLYDGKTNRKGKKAHITQCGTTFGPKPSFNGVIGDLHVVASKKNPTPLLEGDLLAVDEPDNAVACVFDGLTNDGSTPVVGSCSP